MRWRALACMLVVAAFAGAASAQESFRPAAVTGAGLESTDVLPDEMRMTVDIQTTGATADEAIAAYKTKKAAVSKMLVDAGVIVDSIKVGDPAIGGAPQDSNAARMNRLMMTRNGAQAPGDKNKPKPETVTLSFTVKAAWKLTAASVEELLPQVLAIQKKANALAFEDKPAPAARTAEEAEEAEENADEMAMQMQNDYGGNQTGKPSFSFARKIDPAVITAMKGAAYGKAYADAASEARVAGAAITATGLTEVSSYVNAGYLRSSNQSDYYEQMMVERASMMGGRTAAGEDAQVTAIGSDAGVLKVTVHVTAGFDLTFGAPQR